MAICLDMEDIYYACLKQIYIFISSTKKTYTSYKSFHGIDVL